MESYQKISQPYKVEVQDIWQGDIIVEEKIDGSQFRVELDAGEIKCGSHHVDDLSQVDSMFKRATDAAQDIFKDYNHNGNKITIFCEYLGKPKQNAIAYSRTPEKLLTVFDIKVNEKYMDRDGKEAWASTFKGLEIVPLLWKGKGEDFTDEIKEELLSKPSYLGHQAGYDRVEGIVVKNYSKWYDVDKYPYLEGHWLCTKIVNKSFQEKNKVENPSAGNDLQNLKESLHSIPRYRKTYQHLKEKGLITNELKDLALIIPEVKKDIQDEEIQCIKDELFSIYGKDIMSYATKGVAEWYKEFLVEQTKELNNQD